MFKPGYLNVMVDKVIKRVKEPSPSTSRKQIAAWCNANAVDTIDFIKSINSTLADEAISYNILLQDHGSKVIANLPVKMGGGGNCVLLYFLSRLLKPKVVVETGVSLGFSSHAFLYAIQKNGTGHLFSSDFPYFRLPNPERYIGLIVNEDLRVNWTLLINGDTKNLPLIASKVSSIDLFHYDSDKSYRGRQVAINILTEKLNESATIVFDDIGDNSHFKDLVEKRQQPFHVLRNPQGGYVGVIGPVFANR
jgi:predicted O-methyltransferase YrrM